MIFYSAVLVAHSCWLGEERGVRKENCVYVYSIVIVCISIYALLCLFYAVPMNVFVCVFFLWRQQQQKQSGRAMFLRLL